MTGAALERISIELTNQCHKGCWFCYASSTPSGATRWTPDAVIALVRDCALHGVRAVSFGGGEPLEYDGLYEVLTALRGSIFRSLTTNGLLLPEHMGRLIEAAPDKVHVSVHFPGDVARVISQVHTLASHGIASGVNLLVSHSQRETARESALILRAAGIGNERIVYLPMRHQDTPTPREVAEVAGNVPFQSMTCLKACAPSARFCAIAWDRSVGFCSYTRARRVLEAPTHHALMQALSGLGLTFCGGTDGSEIVRLSRRPLDGHVLVRR